MSNVSLSNRTLAFLARPFEGGGGPSHTMIEQIWMAADALDYIPPEEEANKQQRVILGFRNLQRGGKGRDRLPVEADADKLRLVTADLATLLMARELVDASELERALDQDGLLLAGDELKEVRPQDEPADRLATHIAALFGRRPELAVAQRHYGQANSAFDRREWEAANAQLRSACEAVFDALAHANGCRKDKRGGEARKWLQEKGHLEKDEAELIQKFMVFAGRAGSHPGLSGAADSQLRRHMATALMTFAIAKLGAA